MANTIQEVLICGENKLHFSILSLTENKSFINKNFITEMNFVKKRLAVHTEKYVSIVTFQMAKDI
ncbi:hypothetical protein M3O96_08095 [Aquiflexum sp. TKW24L]|uniref:hypothetical protein n=1 Tax=Aquiflexum sp. TKW24L TaxID=2942212 RepID=UPI0020C06BC9|nr:hypothetical protein [Aquiflexum sp. TKW24L]MCL6259043.1 hypothetical protein [Aquiflexum sp. TKW24L]